MRNYCVRMLAVASLMAGSVYGAPLVTNGSLTGPIANFGVPPGWTIFAGSPDTMDEGNNVGVPGALDFVALPIGPSPDGGTWVGIGREGNGFVERFGQSITGFTVGAQYVLSWYFGNFGYNGVTPAYSGDNAFEVFVDGISVGSNPLLPTARTWTAQSLAFTATAVTQEISFQAASGNKSYISIDGISLADANTGIPEPGAAFLIAGGLGVLALLGRKRKGDR